MPDDYPVDGRRVARNRLVAALEPDAVPNYAPLPPLDLDPGRPPVPPGGKPEGELDILSHLAELRARILWSLGFVGMAMVVTWNFGLRIQGWFEAPIRQAFLQSHVKAKLQTIGPTDAFMLYFQIALASALLISAPFVLFQIWRFVEPALTHQERRYSLILVPFSITLFFLGVLLGYVMSPMFFRFFLAFQPPHVEANYSYGESVLLLAKTLLVFGVCFQVPVITIFLNKIGVISRNWMIQYWRHAVVVIFTVVSFITPTWDPVTLIICSIPPCLLYLLSIWLVKWL